MLEGAFHTLKSLLDSLDSQGVTRDKTMMARARKITTSIVTKKKMIMEAEKKSKIMEQQLAMLKGRHDTLAELISMAQATKRQ